ncbi:MAG: YraN family protein [Acidobacteriia bacterium]|nr:YraN family protein [Terriglobia bacterium]
MSGRLTKITIRAIDSIARILPGRSSDPAHLQTGRRGEEEAYFHLRRQGYVIVARNYRTPRHRSELDMIGWDGEVLCFIEVKTRTARGLYPAESAVDAEKQRDLSKIARSFLRKTPGRPPSRFDIVSVYLEPGRDPDIVLFKNAFRMA